MSINHADVLILGSGPAGYTAAIYSARAMQDTLIVSGLQEGGQLTITDDVENYPGFSDAVGGPWLMQQMKEQAINVGARSVNDLIVDVDLTCTPFRLIGDGGVVYTCDALIVATGAQARWLGLDSETRFQGQGVSACATCDGFFYRGQDVVVVGGGNTAVEEALYLSNIARSITVVHRRDSFRCEKILARRLEAKGNITVVWDHQVDEILGGDPARPGVTGVRIRHCHTGAVSDLAASGVFVAIGHAPATSLFDGKLTLTHGGYVEVFPGTTRTSVEGVFAAGDVADHVYRQAVTAAGMGCMAALDAERWLAARALDASHREAA